MRGLGPVEVAAMDAGRGELELEVGVGDGLNVTALVEVVGVIAAAACSSPLSFEDEYWLLEGRAVYGGLLSVVGLPLLKVLSD